MRTFTTLTLSLLAACLACGCANGDGIDLMTARVPAPSYGDSGTTALDGGAASGGDGAVAVDGGAALPAADAGTVAIGGPVPLLCGRTYDQQTDFFTRSGDVSFVSLRHRDGTALPADEGGASCGSTCTEQVTRLANGASLSGVFTGMSTFNIQGASSGEDGVGSVIVDVCGTRLPAFDLAADGTGTPGFNNLPSPGFAVPVEATCVFTITASGGYVDIRAVTTSCPDGPSQPFG